MTGAVISIGSAVVGSTSAAAPRSTETASADFARARAVPSSEAPPSDQLRALSPVLRSDPVSGVLITEYLAHDGKVQTQTPSAVAVAYLRIGLTATGEARQDPNAPSQEA